MLDRRIIKYFFAVVIGFIIGFVASLQWRMIDKRAEEIEKEETALTEEPNYQWRVEHFVINHDNVRDEIVSQNLDFPEIVMAQAAIETGGFKSISCLKDGNLFGLRNKDGSYKRFTHWTESVSYYKKHIQKYDSLPKDYYQYLDRLGYAENPQYTQVIRETAKRYDFSKNKGED